MENIVFLQLRRKYQDVYYYKTTQDFEVDFFLPKEGILIQVAQKFDVPETLEREQGALIVAKQEIKKVQKLIIVTEDVKQELDTEGTKIEVVPLYEWLLFV